LANRLTLKRGGNVALLDARLDRIELLRRHHNEAIPRRGWYGVKFLRIAVQPSRWNRYTILCVHGPFKSPGIADRFLVGFGHAGVGKIIHFSPLRPTFTHFLRKWSTGKEIISEISELKNPALQIENQKCTKSKF
jgi:hypothetical protein